MRIYINFKEALSEIRRDVVEMGIRVHPQTYQDKFVGDDPDFATLEVQNYSYTVTSPKREDLNPNQPWADMEFDERLKRPPVNPGDAYLKRIEIWQEFLQPDCKFAYAYGERLALFNQIERVTERLVVDPDSRQLYLSIWNQEDTTKLGGISRVPCSLGYLLQVRKGKLNLTYLQRSADLVTHFVNDVYLAFCMQEYIAHKTEYPTGTFTHFLGSLHIFRKDAGGVF